MSFAHEIQNWGKVVKIEWWEWHGHENLLFIKDGPRRDGSEHPSQQCNFRKMP